MSAAAPRFSIVTPTFNQGRFIEHTIRSLLAQSFTDFEHIVVDGGSSDGTLDILRAYEGQYRMRWSSGADDGMYDAINKGLKQATGNIHAYLNSDDLYFPWTLEVVADWFARRDGPGLVYGDVINVDDETWREHVRVNPEFDLDRLIHVWPLPQPASFWSREATSVLSGFDQKLQYVGDWDFFIRAAEKFGATKVDEFLAIERRHLASKTLGESDPMGVETDSMLKGHMSRQPSRVALSWMRLRALADRRAVWLRFVSEVRRRDAGVERPWGRLLDACDVRLDYRRLAAGFVPGAPYEWKVGAISSGRDWLDQ